MKQSISNRREASMKTMTCRQLGGACDLEFHAASFDEMAELSKQHGMEMLQKGDQAHLKAMEDMRSHMSDPGAMQRWFDGKRAEFEALPGVE
jgi:preprotein translocase subunit SecA